MTAACLVAIASATLGQAPSLTHVDTYASGFDFPARMAVAPGGGIYVTDPPNNQVVQLFSNGAVAGTFAIPETPLGIAVHSDGRVFVSRGDGAVGVYDAAFTLLGVVDPTPLTLAAPNGLAFDPVAGELYVADSGGHGIVVFAESGGVWGLARAWGVEGWGLLEFESPQAIAWDAAEGRLLVTDVDNFRVQVFDSSGLLLFKFGYRILFTGSGETAWFARGEGIALDTCGNIYVGDALMGTVRAFDSTGSELDPLNTPLLSYGDLKTPMGLLADGTQLYVASTSTGTVEVYDIACGGGAAATSSENTVDRAKARKLAAAQPQYPDTPFEVAAVIHSGEFRREFDFNRDRQIDRIDLEMAVDHFGAGTVDDFLSGDAPVMNPDDPIEPPHLIDIPNLCGRCHSMEGLPGGYLSAEGQENLCVSCHNGAGRAKGTPIAGAAAGNSHPWGIPATQNGVAGPAAGTWSEMDLHLEAGTGNIRCGTCHNPHEQTNGSPYLRNTTEGGALCMECHREEGAPINHAEGTAHGPETCTDCHDIHSTSGTYALVKASMYSWYNGGTVTVGFTDDTIGVGAGGFVDPAAGEFGFCDVCHEYFDDSVNPPVVSAEFAGLLVPHTDTMAVCTDCHGHHNGFRPGLTSGLTGQWAGADTCAICHPGKHADWSGTHHATAWETLNGIGNGDNPFCVGCHTVGYGDPDGFIDHATTPQFEGVQCENCHGDGAAHASDNYGTHPPLNPLDAAVCGACHTGEHHPTFDEWETSGHEASAHDSHNTSCNVCHAPLEAPAHVEEDLGVECAACHDPHKQTGNAADPEPGRDYQLRFPEVVATTPANSIAECTDPTRFNLCGQCHHNRGKVWTDTSRGPHHSQQGNTLVGEMPMPAGEEATPLVPNTVSDHAGLALQCVTCHMYTAPFEEGPPAVDAITGHSWAINYEACVSCHESAENAEALAEGIQALVHARLDGLKAALGDVSLWEYTSDGGPPSASACAADPACTWSQDDVTDDIKKVRFMIHYIEGDGSYGVHNGPYADAMLNEAEALLGIAGGASVYVGETACGACHPTQHGEWAGTIHAVAFDNLPAFAQTNPGCIPCHTVGYGEPTGYVDQATTANLAGVQCENCHGAGGMHILSPTDVTDQPVASKAAEVCGACHTDSHHPTYDEWSLTAHAASAGDSHASSCNVCHAPLEPPAHTPDDLGVECVACHNPHAQTGNAADPEPGRDYQLLYPEVVAPTPSNLIADCTDPSRFNLCGQCHHNRGKVWTDTSRGPHHSQQGNTLAGEMPMPAGEEGTPLVPNTASDHAVVPLQCVTCHMYTAPMEEGPPEVDALTGHSWAVNFEACIGCHETAENAEALAEGTQALVHARIDGLKAALGDVSLWEYTSDGGPPSATDCAADPTCGWSQDDVTDDIKKVRFMIHYIEGDGSYGVHNGAYTDEMLNECETLLGIAGGAAIYVGETTCGACHPTQHAEWDATIHAAAFDNLPAFAQVDPGCIPCHTVGFGEPTGYVDMVTTPNLAGVQCENCHGAGGMHVLSPTDVSDQPVASVAGELCGSCHTDTHHPTYDEWATTAHATSAGDSHSSSCEVCHAPLQSPAGVPEDPGVECVACHNPHAQTGNAINPTPGRDYQLLFAEYVVSPASNVVADCTDPARFNLCGQCHHSRGKIYTDTSRGPHHSMQGNFLFGEMPMPAGEEGSPLTANIATTHALAEKQCATCHMYTADHQTGPPEVDAITGHTWQVNTIRCNTAPGCHTSPASAEASLAVVQATVQAGLDDITTRLGDPATWEYTSDGGPPSAADCAADPSCTLSQDGVDVFKKQVRFMVHYILGDGSLGGHNPPYTVQMVTDAQAILTANGL